MSQVAAERLVAGVLAEDLSVLSNQQAAMVRFAMKLTNTPSAMHCSDVDALRAAGLSDRAVLDLYARRLWLTIPDTNSLPPVS